MLTTDTVSLHPHGPAARPTFVTATAGTGTPLGLGEAPPTQAEYFSSASERSRITRARIIIRPSNQVRIFCVFGAGDQLLCRSQSNKTRMFAIAIACQTGEPDVRGSRHRACAQERRSGYHDLVGVWRGATHRPAATRTHDGESTRQPPLTSHVLPPGTRLLLAGEASLHVPGDTRSPARHRLVHRFLIHCSPAMTNTDSARHARHA